MIQKLHIWVIRVEIFFLFDLSGNLFDQMIKVSEAIKVCELWLHFLEMILQIKIGCRKCLNHFLLLIFILADLLIDGHGGEFQIILVRVRSGQVKCTIHF